MQKPSLDIFQVIADPCRRQIIGMLTVNNLTVNSIAREFKISRPAISKHIKILELAGFLEIEDRGRERLCIISYHGFKEIRGWLDYYDNFWKDRLSSLETLINSEGENG